MLTDFEEKVLEAVKILQPDAYGVPICKAVGRVGRTYNTLHELTANGYLTAHQKEGHGRNGNLKTCYELTGKGKRGLLEKSREQSESSLPCGAIWQPA